MLLSAQGSNITSHRSISDQGVQDDPSSMAIRYFPFSKGYDIPEIFHTYSRDIPEIWHSFKVWNISGSFE